MLTINSIRNKYEHEPHNIKWQSYVGNTKITIIFYDSITIIKMLIYGEKMNIYVIRHGETDMGKNEIIATMDEPLNSNGIQQAINVGKKVNDLNLDVIYCSPIQRAKHTL